MWSFTISHSAPQEIMYKKYYWYRSGVTQTMQKALKEIYTTVKKKKLINPKRCNFRYRGK